MIKPPPSQIKPSQLSIITSLTNSTVKQLTSLRLEKFRHEHELFLVEGVRMVRDAQRAGRVPKILAVHHDQSHQPEAVSLMKGCETVISVTEEILTKITSKENPQLVVAAYEIKRQPLSSINPQAGDLFIALDRVRDPGNLGSVIRSADAAGAAGVVLIGASCDPYAPEAIRASTGSIFHVPVFEGTEADFIAVARKWPGSVVGTAAAGRVEYRNVKYEAPSLIVMGTEQSGMSAAIERACTTVVRIPIHGRAESLNLAAAAALMLYGARESGELTKGIS